MDTTKKANQELRKAMKDKGMKFWQLADLVGVTETTLVKWFRHDLPEVKSKAIKHYIDQFQG